MLGIPPGPGWLSCRPPEAALPTLSSPTLPSPSSFSNLSPQGQSVHLASPFPDPTGVPITPPLPPAKGHQSLCCWRPAGRGAPLCSQSVRGSANNPLAGQGGAQGQTAEEGREGGLETGRPGGGSRTAAPGSEEWLMQGTDGGWPSMLSCTVGPHPWGRGPAGWRPAALCAVPRGSWAAEGQKGLGQLRGQLLGKAAPSFPGRPPSRAPLCSLHPRGGRVPAGDGGESLSSTSVWPRP